MQCASRMESVAENQWFRISNLDLGYTFKAWQTEWFVFGWINQIPKRTYDNISVCPKNLRAFLLELLTLMTFRARSRSFLKRAWYYVQSTIIFYPAFIVKWPQPFLSSVHRFDEMSVGRHKTATNCRDHDCWLLLLAGAQIRNFISCCPI